MGSGTDYPRTKYRQQQNIGKFYSISSHLHRASFVLGVKCFRSSSWLARGKSVLLLGFNGIPCHPVGVWPMSEKCSAAYFAGTILVLSFFALGTG